MNVEVEPASVGEEISEPSVVPVWAGDPSVSLLESFERGGVRFSAGVAACVEAVAVSVVVMSPSSRLSSTGDSDGLAVFQLLCECQR